MQCQKCYHFLSFSLSSFIYTWKNPSGRRSKAQTEQRFFFFFFLGHKLNSLGKSKQQRRRMRREVWVEEVKTGPSAKNSYFRAMLSRVGNSKVLSFAVIFCRVRSLMWLTAHYHLLPLTQTRQTKGREKKAFFAVTLYCSLETVKWEQKQLKLFVKLCRLKYICK